MKRQVNLKLIFYAGLFLLIQCQSRKPSSMIDTSTVPEVDLKRYMGTWYEIARFPHSFEKNLAGVTATYTLRGDGKIEVLIQPRSLGLQSSGRPPVKAASEFPFQ